MVFEDKVPIEPLDVNNYATWRGRMKFLLILKGLWQTVSIGGDTSDKSEQAQAILGLHVKDHLLSVIEESSSPKEAWEKLEALFQTNTNARKRQLRKELAMLKMYSGEPLAKYISCAKDLSDQLLKGGHTVSEQEVVWYILAGLESAYDTVVTILETTTTGDMKMSEILPKLLAVEQQLKGRGNSIFGNGEAALVAKETRICHYCGKRGHIRRACWKRQQDEQSRQSSGKVSYAIAL